MRIYENVKVFDIRNPNCTIENSLESIIEMFDKTPIVTEIYDKENERLIEKDKQVAIGYVDKITNKDEFCLYGEVCILNEISFNAEFINYTIEGGFKYSDDNVRTFVVDKVACIEIR